MRFIALICLMLALLAGCASGPDRVEVLRLSQQVHAERLKALENADPGVTEAELQKRLTDLREGIRRTYGQAAFEAMGRDMDLVAQRYGQFEQRLERLENWLSRSRTKALVEGGDISVFENPPVTALPEPKYSEKELGEFMPAVSDALDAARRHHEAKRLSLADFWLGEAVREVRGRQSLVLQLVERGPDNQPFRAWARRLLTSQQQSEAAAP